MIPCAATVCSTLPACDRYTPLTYLKPTGRKEVLRFEAGEVSANSPVQTFTILEVEAQM